MFLGFRVCFRPEDEAAYQQCSYSVVFNPRTPKKLNPKPPSAKPYLQAPCPTLLTLLAKSTGLPSNPRLRVGFRGGGGGGIEAQGTQPVDFEGSGMFVVCDLGVLGGRGVSSFFWVVVLIEGRLAVLCYICCRHHQHRHMNTNP